jgi:DnaJ family protein A protein 2
MASIDVTLAESLTGFNRVVIKHLDGRGIEIQHPKVPGQVLSPGQVLKVPGEGMPIKRSDARGDLYLVVNIKFPDEQWKPSAAVLERLKEMLPQSDVRVQADTAEDVQYDTNGKLEDFGSKDPSGGSAWEDDEEEGGQAQCATQ